MNKYNVVLFTCDDLNYDSIGCFGSKVKAVSPNIDYFCKQATKMDNAFVTIGVCQPSRSVMMTGRYPHKNGARGFEAIDTSCTTLTERLSENGYYNGIIGKEYHLTPTKKFFWDEFVTTMNSESDFGRSPENYYVNTNNFVTNAKAKDKPFFLMVNSHDPHRAYAGSEEEIKMFGRHLKCDYNYKPEEIEVNEALCDIPKVREELAQYYSSVKRADQCFGRVVECLKENDVYDNSLIIFLSDNGMSFPFCKSNCYYNSTKSPYIVKLPKEMQKNANSQCNALINGIDITPTILDILKIKHIEGVDGKSFLNCMFDPNEEIHTEIYTQFFKTILNNKDIETGLYPMRAINNNKYVYIYNGWSDGKLEFKNDSMRGLSFKAMQEAAANNKEINDRVNMFLYRTKEELYDIQNDKAALNNLADKKEFIETCNALRLKMYEYMQKTQDGFVDKFQKEVIEPYELL